MFERYTENARRAIFFARYEASRFGCSYIETEHLLLGVLREDKGLVKQFLGSHDRLENIRRSIEQRATDRPSISTSVDLPLSHESKRVLAYGAEEAERMRHKHLGTAHLLLGLMREEKSFAAQLLHDQGLTTDQVRKEVQRTEVSLSGPVPGPARSASIAGLYTWIDELEARGGIRVVQRGRCGDRRTHFALYATDTPQQNASPAEKKLAEIQNRIDHIVEKMEHAIASHEFEKARFYSDEERKEREDKRRLCEEFNLEEPPPLVPVLCIEVIGDDLFSAVRRRCDDHLAEGAGEVWLLDAVLKRAYTFTKDEGLREFKGEVLRISEPPIEMDTRTVFD